jgi:hypothetical protein
MKTNKFKFILLAALLPLLLLILSFTNLESEVQYATIRTVEATAGASTIILAYEGKVEELDLEKWTGNNLAPNALKINKAINLMTSKGYKLISQSGGDYVSMYTFESK